MALHERGFDLIKLFPAGPLGGMAFLKALAAPLPEIEFCPTGGIGPDTPPDYLACPHSACRGRSGPPPPSSHPSKAPGSGRQPSTSSR